MRVRSALYQLNVNANEFAITVNLAPAYLRKSGTAYDLPLALGLLASLGKVSVERIRDTVLRVSALLRIAVLMNRTRSNYPLPKIKAKADRDRLKIKFPQDWLTEHPLTLADLEQEQAKLKRLGVQLEL